jgi:hypothetical protein
LLPDPLVDTRAFSTNSSPCSSSGKPQGKSGKKLPGRSLIRPGTGLTKAEKAAIVFPNETQEIINGMLLGDGHLELRDRFKNARLVIHQKDREFVQFLWEHFNSIGILGAAPHENRSIMKSSGNLQYHFNLLLSTFLFLLKLILNGIKKLMVRKSRLYLLILVNS